MLQTQASQGSLTIEALISIGIISLSVAAYSSLQVQALASIQQSIWRNQASFIAQDIATRMRLNQHPSLGGEFSYANSKLWSQGSTAPAVSCTAINNPCTPQKMLSYDIADISQFTKKYLPQGQIIVSRDGNFYHIYLAWRQTSMHKCMDQPGYKYCLLLKVAADD